MKNAAEQCFILFKTKLNQ